MWGTNKDSSDKLRRKVSKLRGKRKFGEAVELQRQLCQSGNPTVTDWQLLGELAREAKLPRVELAAGLMTARLERAGPEKWLSLAEMADAAGLSTEAIDATFRAADAAAVSGDCRLALSLCEKVLARQPDHSAARRIRGVMQARVETFGDAESDSESEDDASSAAASEWKPEQSNVTLLGAHAADDWPSSAAGGISQELAIVPETPETLTDWPPTGEQALPQSQPWPTVLQERSLLFVGQIEDLPSSEELSKLLEARQFHAGDVILDEGDSCELLYRLEQGTVRASRTEETMVELGQIPAGSFFGDAGALSRLPASARVEALEDCKVSIISRRKLRELMDLESNQSTLGLLKSLYLDAVLSICPLLGSCPREQWQHLGRDWRFMTVKGGQQVLAAGQSSPLHIIVAGFAEVTIGGGEQTSLGRLVPGDLIAEVDPSPVTVTARRNLYAIAIERRMLADLPDAARSALEARATRCRDVCQETTAATAKGE